MPLVLPGMHKRTWGRLIGIGSHPARVSPSYAYKAAEGARMQAPLLAQGELWQRGVTVNVIAPGPVAPIAALGKAIEQCGHGAAWRRRTNVFPQDIAEGVRFPCSEAGRFVTGCCLRCLFH